MVDETTDCSNREQAVLVLQYVDDNLEVQWLNLSISQAHGQCYDGASAMSGTKSGVARTITDLEKRAVYCIAMAML